MKKVSFCSHAEEKFTILEEHGFIISRAKVLDAFKNPDKVEKGLNGRLIAQKAIDEKHVIRVVFEKKEKSYIIVTFYPGRRNYYES